MIILVITAALIALAAVLGRRTENPDIHREIARLARESLRRQLNPKPDRAARWTII